MPNLADRPLIDTDRDSRLFVDRETEQAGILKAINYGLNTLVVGERGMGRTSFLHQIMLQLRSQKRGFILINGAMAETAEEFLDMVSWALGVPRQTRVPGAVETFGAGSQVLFGGNRPVGRPDLLIQSIRGLGERLPAVDTPTVVLVDDADPGISHTVFGRARDEVWVLPLLWIVAGDTARAGDFMRPPADAFFSRQMNLGPLTHEASVDFLQRRCGDVLAPAAIAAIAEQAAGRPRQLTRLAREIVLGDRPADDVLAGEQERLRRLAQLGPPAQRLYEVLLSLGSASAGDRRLLEQLKWTRPRAAQVFSELENLGVVTSATEKAPSAGRPRKVYRVA